MAMQVNMFYAADEIDFLKAIPFRKKDISKLVDD